MPPTPPGFAEAPHPFLPPHQALQSRSSEPSRPDAPILATDRRRLGAPGLRTFEAIADLWRLTEVERLAILGHPSRSTYYSWVKTASSGGDITPSLDTMLRLSAVLGIHKALAILFATEAERLDWLRTPHATPLFGNAPPLALMTAPTQDGLIQTRRFLDAARGGLYMPPPATGASAPFTDQDIAII